MDDTLYVSDLDGTLLDGQAALSPFTIQAINALLHRGLRFTYATARSYTSAHAILAPLRLTLPAICYNGARIVDGQSGNTLRQYSLLGQDAAALRGLLQREDTAVMVYAGIDGRERMSWLSDRPHAAMEVHLAARRDDPRLRPVTDWQALFEGDVFYITCMGTQEELNALRRAADVLASPRAWQCILQQEASGYWWMEFMPGEATKANGIQAVLDMLGMESAVCFGDGLNDIPMFEHCREAYAVANAHPDLKAHATGVIASNENDGVARFLLDRFT